MVPSQCVETEDIRACLRFATALMDRLCEPPPRIIHLRIGNMQLRDLHSFLQRIWPRVEELSASSRLVIVRQTLIECVS